jgi:signal transduction histidine kinase/ActR/RegA family two-component response regulator
VRDFLRTAGYRDDGPVGPETDDRLRSELVALAAGNKPISIAAAVLNGLAVALLVHGRLGATLAGVPIEWLWLGALLGVTAVRVATIVAYWRRARGRPQLWYRLFSAGTLAHAVIWSLAGALFFQVESDGIRTFVVMLQAGMVAGGVSTLSPLRGAALAWVTLLVLPITWHSFALGGTLWTVFACNSLLFLATELTAVLHAHQRFVRSVRLALENEGLCSSLSRSTAALETARDAALQAAAAKSEFLANMSHEIRTPMTSILGYASLVRDHKEGEDVSEHMDAIQRNANHLLTIINDILDLSKIDAGKMTLERVVCVPSEVVGSAVAMLQPRAQESGLELKAAIVPPFPREIRSDPVRLRQILVNLLSNAVKFTPKGSVELEASTRRSGERAALVIRVTDTGIGMTEAQLAELFEPFHQADTTITRRFGGTGLGLSVSRRLARMLGGDLSASSAFGAGSCFELTLDIGTWQEFEATPPERRLKVRPPGTARPLKRLRGHVLLAEDGKDNQRLIRLLLQRHGLEVELAENGLQALERAESARRASRSHDLFLLDVQMPEMDGLSAARELKRRGFEEPIVALTAQAMVGDREAFLADGFDDYESKPIDPVRLERMLARYLPEEDPPRKA